MYIAKELTERSTQVVFINHLKELLMSTGIFTLVEENFEKYGFFKLKYKNVIIEIEGTGNGELKYSYKLIIEGNETLQMYRSITIGANGFVDTRTRSVKVFLVSNKNNLFFKITRYDYELLDINNSSRLIVTDNDLYIFASSGTTSANAIDIIESAYTYRPYHSYSKSPTELFLDPELPWTKASDGSFHSNSIGITGLGGAECGKIYQLADGTKYYAIFNNMAIEMGEEFVYESTEV